MQCLPLARAIPLFALAVILPVRASAASITTTYGSYVAVSTGGYYPDLLPIAGFDSRLGRLDSATVSLTLTGGGIIDYYCPDPFGSGGDCGQWVYDVPEIPEWVPNLYPYPLTFRLSVYTTIFPESFLPLWNTPDWLTVPRADILNDNRSFISSPCGAQDFCFEGPATFTSTSSNPIFAADPKLVAYVETQLGVDAQNSDVYQFNTGWFNGDMTLSVRYDYEPVPEPNPAVMALLALLSMPLLKKLLPAG